MDALATFVRGPGMPSTKVHRNSFVSSTVRRSVSYSRAVSNPRQRTKHLATVCACLQLLLTEHHLTTKKQEVRAEKKFAGERIVTNASSAQPPRRCPVIASKSPSPGTAPKSSPLTSSRHRPRIQFSFSVGRPRKLCRRTAPATVREWRDRRTLPSYLSR
jgi:hypothetical protein